MGALRGTRILECGKLVAAPYAANWLCVSPGALDDASLPPLKAFGQQGDFQGGVQGAIATLRALRARRRTGRGEHVDVNVQAVIAANIEMNVVHWTYTRRVSSRPASAPKRSWIPS